MFGIEWEYLTGKVVARDYHGGLNGDKPEWPPHPDRVYQALVAAWGGMPESDRKTKSEEALRWLARQNSPSVYAPDIAATDIPVAPHVWVPVNYLKMGLRELHSRSRRDRTFPSVPFPEIKGKKNICALIWQDSNPDQKLLDALNQLCASVTYIGHSRSFVRMQVTNNPPDPVWIPFSGGIRNSEILLRVPSTNRLDMLREAYERGERPPMACCAGYVRSDAIQSSVPRGEFGDEFIVFRKVDRDNMLSLINAPIFTNALRRTIVSAISDAGAGLEIASGHSRNGEPTKKTHIAYVPLPFVGDKYADGHVLGFALVLPKHVSYTEKNSIWKAIASALDPETDTLRLVAGNSGTCLLVPEERLEPSLGLRKKTWCARARRWGSVTPFVLDRMPPRRHADYDGWSAKQIADVCERQGLPIPEEISISEVSSLRGVPRAREFSPFLRKDGTRRWHTNVDIVFPVPIEGPLLLGAGRYRGYGLFKPVFSQREVE